MPRTTRERGNTLLILDESRSNFGAAVALLPALHPDEPIGCTRLPDALIREPRPLLLNATVHPPIVTVYPLNVTVHPPNATVYTHLALPVRRAPELERSGLRNSASRSSASRWHGRGLERFSAV